MQQLDSNEYMLYSHYYSLDLQRWWSYSHTRDIYSSKRTVMTDRVRIIFTGF